MILWKCDFCVWHPPTFDIEWPNFLCKRNSGLKQVSTHFLVRCLKYAAYFWGAPQSSLLLFWDKQKIIEPVKSQHVRKNEKITWIFSQISTFYLWCMSMRLFLASPSFFPKFLLSKLIVLVTTVNRRNWAKILGGPNCSGPSKLALCKHNHAFVPF